MSWTQPARDAAKRHNIDIHQVMALVAMMEPGITKFQFQNITFKAFIVTGCCPVISLSN